MSSLKDEFEAKNVRNPSPRRTGLSLPLQDNRLGGLKLISGSENDHKIISLAVMSNSSTNAFQQPRIDVEGATFELDDTTFIALIRRKLEFVFSVFEREHRYRLLPGTIKTQSDADGRVFVFFDYQNIEADTTESIQLEVGAIT